LDILPTIQRIAASGRSPKSWSYFAQPIMDAKASRETPAPIGRATGPPQRQKPPDGRDFIKQALASIESQRHDDGSQFEATGAPIRLLAASTGRG